MLCSARSASGAMGSQDLSDLDLTPNSTPLPSQSSLKAKPVCNLLPSLSTYHS